MFTREVESIINNAGTLARQSQHKYVTPEHVLLITLSSQTIISLFDSLNIEAEDLKEDLSVYLSKTEMATGPLIMTDDFNKLLQMATTNARTSNRTVIDSYDLFIAFFHLDKNSNAKYLLSKYEIEKDEVIAVVNEARLTLMNKEGGGPDNLNQKDDISGYLINLNERAAQDKIDPVIGREKEIEKVIQTLVRKKKNNPILVGEAGTGKTSIAEGLAKMIVNKKAHPAIADHIVFSLDLGGMTAGTKYRGEFEERLKKVINKVKSSPNHILFIDEIHTIVGAGSGGNGGLDASNILKPALSSGDIKCIGATTYKEYRNVFEKDAALSRRFQKVDVDETSVEDTKKILFGLKKHYESFHKVEFSNDAIDLAVDLAAKHLTNRFFPDKAIDILDEAGAFVKLNKEDKKVTTEEIEKVISRIANIPEKQLITSEKDKVRDLKKNLEMTIFGQQQAIDTLTDAILLNKSGLREDNKPIGSFLFAGPTGVGKTELAKQLALNLGIHFTRIDMSEYGEKHNVSKLIGAPPGYVGYEQEGVLNSIAKNPHSLLLMDEIEKAHPDVWNILLQVMDNGFLTDNYGKKIDFRNTVVIMTSNVGVSEMNQKVMGLGVAEERQTVPMESIKKAFAPEFLNRLDSIVWFKSLDKTIIRDVLNKNLISLDNMLSKKNVFIDYTDEAKNWLVDKGYNPAMGARPMARLIQDKVKAVLSKEILFGKLEKGGKVLVSLENNELIFSYDEKKTKPTAVKKAKIL